MVALVHHSKGATIESTCQAKNEPSSRNKLPTRTKFTTTIKTHEKLKKITQNGYCYGH